MPPGKMASEKCPPENCPEENCHPPPENPPPRKITPPSPLKFFLGIFSYLKIFLMKVSSIRYIYFHSIIFFVINFFILYVCIIFSKAYIFDFQAWNIMFIIHICVTNNAGHRYLATRSFYKQRFFQLSLSVA